jgi:hypothetical protein
MVWWVFAASLERFQAAIPREGTLGRTKWILEKNQVKTDYFFPETFVCFSEP